MARWQHMPKRGSKYKYFEFIFPAYADHMCVSVCVCVCKQ